jgi:LPXTG-motif cell wall-anchored protein
MRGQPITRATSADGRWAYTLYDGAGGEPFVHALDTTARSAACIDLPMLEGRRDLPALRLALAGAQLRVVARGHDVALVNTKTFAALRPAAAPVGNGPGDSGGPWLIAGGAAAALLFAGAAALRRRRTATA